MGIFSLLATLAILDEEWPVDRHAPPRRNKRYPNLPWQCQVMCHGECTSGEGECPPERITPLPAPRPDRWQVWL
jgi:hypothetical protein